MSGSMPSCGTMRPRRRGATSTRSVGTWTGPRWSGAFASPRPCTQPRRHDRAIALGYTGSRHGHQEELRQEQEEQEARRGGLGRARGHLAARSESEARAVAASAAVSASPSSGRRGLRHLALKTRDLRATERFYTDVLGLQIAFPHPGMIFLETPGGRDLLNFVKTRRPFDPRAGGFEHFGLSVTPAGLRRLHTRLRQAGVPIRARRGHTAVYVRDPNGYTVELYSD